MLAERLFLSRLKGKATRQRKNKRRIGADYEKKAANYLRTVGYRIIEQNYRCPQGEIDLIARDGSYLVFIEVKYRKNLSAGYGEEAVGYRKQMRIRKTAIWYLNTRGIGLEQPCRFDVISFAAEKLTLLQNAF